jgi:tRNA(fMet)-specific endonuclease VapC
VKYLLDTNICIYISRRKPAGVLSRLQNLKPEDVGMSIVTYLELVYGAWKSERVEANLARIDQFRDLIPVQPLDAGVAEHYGRVRTELERAGTPIGAYDLMIAAHAMSLGLTLVTNNVREFRRVRGLRVENWVE